MSVFTKLFLIVLKVGGSIAQWLGHQSLAGGLSLPCARSMADRWPFCG